MKKILLAMAVALTFIAAPVFSVEWGGVFRNETSTSLNDIDKISDFTAYEIHQADSLYLWLNKGLSYDSNWYFSAEAYYKFKFDNIAGVNNFKHIVDLDLLKIAGKVVAPKTVLNFAFGRYFVIDNSTSVFAQTCDGISVKASFPSIDLSFYSGYTGLLNSLTVSMLDKDTLAAPSFGASDLIYSMSHSYVPLILSIELPAFAGVQTLGIQASAFLDLVQDNPYNRFYANVMMKGPIVGSLFYSVNTTFGFPNFNQVSNLSEISFAGYVSDIAAVYAGVKYASGNHGFLSSFRGVSSSPAYNSYSLPELSGMLIPSLKILFNFDQLAVKFDSKYVFSCPDTEIHFSGLGADIAIDINIFSDLQLGFNFQGYVDLQRTETFTDSNVKAGVNLSFSF